MRVGFKKSVVVVVTMKLLSKIEERLSDFEEKENKIMQKYRNFSEVILV